MVLEDIIRLSSELIAKGKRFLEDGNGWFYDTVHYWAGRHPKLFGCAAGVLGGLVTYLIGRGFEPPLDSAASYYFDYSDFENGLAIKSSVIGVAAGLAGYRYACIEHKLRTSPLGYRLFKKFEDMFANSPSTVNPVIDFISRNRVFSAALFGALPYALAFSYVLATPFLHKMVSGVDFPLSDYLTFIVKGTNAIFKTMPPSTFLMYSIAGYAVSFPLQTVSYWPHALQMLRGVFSSTLTGNKSHLIGTLEALVDKHHSLYDRYLLVHKCLTQGYLDKGLWHLKTAAGYSGERARLVPRGLPLMGNVKDLVADAAFNIGTGKGTIPDYVVLASFADLNGERSAAEELITESAQKHSSPMEHWVYSMFFHSTGNMPARNRHLEIVLPMLYDDAETFRREPLGEGSSRTVFVIANPVFRDDAVFVMHPSLDALRFDAKKIKEAGDALRPFNSALPHSAYAYAAPEPWFVDFLGEPPVPVYVRTQARGETLLHFLQSGEAGLDDMLAAWELASIIHNSPEVTVTGLKSYTVAQRLGLSLSRGYLNLPESVKRALLQCAVLADNCLYGTPVAINLDLHGENIIVSYSDHGVASASGRKMSLIEIENRGLIQPEVDAANLFRYVRVPQLGDAEEDEFLKIAGINPLRYYNAAVYRAVALSLAWMDPKRPRMNSLVPQKIQDGIHAVEQIRNTIPLSYPGFKPDYEAVVSGLEELGRIAA
ncbi:hypothetical protein HYV82_00765 [Candidatus Woesearchaeota archaeon]|nr:hypothetical protein [Candidatus Woesearchaeota archaeon]